MDVFNQRKVEPYRNHATSTAPHDTRLRAYLADHAELDASSEKVVHPAQSFANDHYPYVMRSEAESLRAHQHRAFPPHIYGFILGGAHLVLAIIVTAFALTYLNSQIGESAQFIPKTLVWMGMIILPFVVSVGMFLISTLVFFQIQKRFDWMLKTDGRAHRKEIKKMRKSFGLKKATLRRQIEPFALRN